MSEYVEVPDLLSVQNYLGCSAVCSPRCASPECGPSGSPALVSSYPEKEQENSSCSPSPSTTMSLERSPFSSRPVSPLHAQNTSTFQQTHSKTGPFLTEADFRSRLAMLSEVSIMKENIEHSNGLVFTNGYCHSPKEEAVNKVRSSNGWSDNIDVTYVDATEPNPVNFQSHILSVQSVSSPVIPTSAVISRSGLVFPGQLSPTEFHYSNGIWYTAVPVVPVEERQLQLPSYQQDKPATNGVDHPKEKGVVESEKNKADCPACLENINGEVKAEDDSPAAAVKPRVQRRRKRSELGPYFCDLCSDSFTSTNLLGQHMRIHTMSKPFTCHYCKKTFTQRSHLTRHLYTHTGEKPYKCPHCERSFARSTTLADHINTHTHSRPHKCWYCDKAFNQKSGLRYHIRTHTGERPFDCRYCFRSFISSSQLVKHICRPESTKTGESSNIE